MWTSRVILGGVSGLVAVLAVRAWTQDVPPSFAALKGRIAFVSSRDGNREIYSCRPDGSDLLRLTTTAANETWPDWSPDGARLAFISDQPGRSAVYVMDSDGANVTPVCPDVLVRPTRARWSPDGLCLAVVEDLHVGGGEDKALIEATKDKRDGIALVVPPDGEPKIIFEATDIGGTCWSPDGKALALVRGGVTDDVVVIDRGGAVLCQQDMGTGVAEIDWSPDGHWLYYDRQGIGSTPRAGMLELLTVTAPVEIDGYTVRGTGERVVTAAEAATEVFFQPTHNDRALRFSPYGGAAVYQCDAAGWSNDELRVAVGALPFTPLCMTRGKPATNITNQSAEDEMPCWGR